MNYEKLDNEELLRLALDAVNGNHDADAVVMLKTLLERDPQHVYAQYLLAAQHAQLGLMDRAEAGFRSVVNLAPDFAIARFQLAQLLLVKGATEEARQLFAPLLGNRDALGGYARALDFAVTDDIGSAMREVRSALALPQEIPALAADMHRLLGQWQQLVEASGQTIPVPIPDSTPTSAGAPMLLANYGRGG